MDRRGFIRAGVGTVGLGAVAACSGPDFLAPPIWDAPWNGSLFSLGVMSGLHSPSEVVLWTRLDPDLAPGVTEVAWRLCDSPNMAVEVASGTVPVGPASDHTIKIKPSGLAADTQYWFEFLVGSERSPVGRARTLPAPGAALESLRLAFCSCQNWTHGWYSAWDAIAAEDVDAVLFLGDYIYESDGFIAGRSVRRDTVGDADDLDTYRAKYRMYRSDPAIQGAHAAHPTVPVWDDHEVFNNRHAADLAADPDRADAAHQAWFEYMPVWPIDGSRIHRRLNWGALADLFLLDTRQYRDIQPGPADAAGTWVGVGDILKVAADPGRSILGVDQRGWLLDGLGASKADDVTWRLVGNQVMVHPWRLLDLDTPELRALDPHMPKHNGLYANLDSWDGYQADRDLLFAHLADNGIDNTSFLTGDVHSFWQGTLRSDYDDPTSPYVVNEFVGGSISSSSFDLVGDLAFAFEESAKSWSPAFRYVDLRRRGYGVVRCTPSSMSVDFNITNERFRNGSTVNAVTFEVADGDARPSVA